MFDDVPIVPRAICSGFLYEFDFVRFDSIRRVWGCFHYFNLSALFKAVSIVETRTFCLYTCVGGRNKSRFLHVLVK